MSRMTPGAAVRREGVEVWKVPPTDTAGLQEMCSLYQAQRREMTCLRLHHELAIKLRLESPFLA